VHAVIIFTSIASIGDIEERKRLKYFVVDKFNAQKEQLQGQVLINKMDLVDEDVKYNSNSIYESPIVKTKLDDFNENFIIGEETVFPHLNYPGDYGYSRNLIIELLSLKALFRALKQASFFILNNAPNVDEPEVDEPEVVLPSIQNNESEDISTVECQICKNIYNIDFDMCFKCGTENTQKTTCSRCKKNYNINFFACTNCGLPNPLKQKPTSTSNTPKLDEVTCSDCGSVFPMDYFCCNKCGTKNNKN